MKLEPQDLLDQLQSPDANTRYKAWRNAGPTGAEVIPGLADLMASPDKSIAKCARGALETITHYAAKPGNANDARAVAANLLKVADSSRPRMVRADALTLVAFVGDSHSVPTLVKLLDDADVHEEARMALERIPGSASLNALKKAAATVPDSYKPNISQSLHDRALTPATVGVANGR